MILKNLRRSPSIKTRLADCRSCQQLAFRSPAVIPMWAHYAQNSEGVVVDRKMIAGRLRIAKKQQKPS